MTAGDPIIDARGLIARATKEGVILRALGGVAIALRCPSARSEPLARTYSDVDVLMLRRDHKQIDRVLGSAGYLPDVGFNAMQGKERRIYHDARGAKLEVFIEKFVMCQEIPLTAERAALHPETVPLAELFLTKAQIVELNQKDGKDLFALFHDHDIGEDDEGINAHHIAKLCSDDWGLWRTIDGMLSALSAFAADIDVRDTDRRRVLQRIALLRERLAAAPKSRKWRLRARVGERVRWYLLPEEPRGVVRVRDA